MAAKRPVAVPGANTLRGGTNSYGAKTLNSNWVEDRKAPQFGGAKAHSDTEQAARALEATRASVPTFGTALVPSTAGFEERIDYGNIVGYDTKAGPSTWSSVTSSTYVSPATAAGAAPSEFSTSFRTLSHPKTVELEDYKKRWLSGTDASATGSRFETEASASLGASAAPAFRSRSVRVLRGVPKAVETFRERIVARGGMLAIRSIGRLFRIMDDSGDKKLSQTELRHGLQDYGLRFSEEEFIGLWRYLDRDGSGTIDYDEFLRGIRGDMNERRVGMVAQAWAVLDKTGDDRVTIDDLRGTYDPAFHPDVISGKITPDQALLQFLDQWDTVEKDGVVSFDEFGEYYNDVSASIDEDDYFELMMRNAWHLSGGSGVTANTSCLRVLVTRSDGSKAVETVAADLGLRRGDLAGIKARLIKQGITDVVEVSTSF